MNTLTLFPSLLTYGLLAPTLLRLTLGILGLIGAKQRLSKNYKTASLLYFITSVLIILGLYTQIAIIVAFLLIGFDDWADKQKSPLSKERVISRIVLAIIAISLLFTGPGIFAFDLPL